jgi:hypothetical protein
MRPAISGVALQGRIDHLKITVKGSRDSLEDLVPNTHLPPADEAVVAGRGRTIPLWDICPR